MKNHSSKSTAEIINLEDVKASAGNDEVKRRQNRRFLEFVIIAFVFLVSLWITLSFSASLVCSTIVFMNAGEYVPADFVVTSYHVPSGRSSEKYCHFKGTINGVSERLAAGAEEKYRAGDTIRVLYNPKMSAIMIQSETFRVINYSKDLRRNKLELIVWTLCLGIIPLAISVIVLMRSVRFYRRYKKENNV